MKKKPLTAEKAANVRRAHSSKKKTFATLLKVVTVRMMNVSARCSVSQYCDLVISLVLGKWFLLHDCFSVVR